MSVMVSDARSFDFNNVRTEITEDHHAVRSGERFAEFDDLNSIEKHGHSMNYIEPNRAKDECSNPETIQTNFPCLGRGVLRQY
jgi:hypothetical protein